ncbi:MAG: glutaminase [Microthrixaceae bacterium]
MKQPDALQLSQDPDLSDEKVKRRAWFVEVIVGLHEKLAALDDGRPADYIPQLAEVDPDQFAIAAFTTDGAAVGVGDTEHAFTIQSVSKLLTYGLALETHGREAVLERRAAPTGESFNAIVLDDDANRAPNPMVVTGKYCGDRPGGRR